MKQGQRAVITQLLFTEGEKGSPICIIANSILQGDFSFREKISWILDDPGNIRIMTEELEPQERLSSPCLLECKFDEVRRVIAATLVACAEETHNFVNSLYHYSQSPPCPLDVRDGCVFGLLDVLNHNKVSLTGEGVCDFYKELGNCTSQSAVMLLILELLWQDREGGDALPSEKAGELTNLIGEYMANEGGGWFKGSVRKDSLRNFLKRACARYNDSHSFPSELADAVVTTFVYQTIGFIPKSKLLQLASEAIDAPTD